MTAKRYYIVRVTDSGLLYYAGFNKWNTTKQYALLYRTEIEASEINAKLQRRKYQTEINEIEKKII